MVDRRRPWHFPGDWPASAPADALLRADTEAARQQSVERYGLAGRAAWQRPDDWLVTLVDLAHRRVGLDHVVINILDGRRQWSITARRGSRVVLSPRSISVCHHMLARTGTDDVMLLEDASLDPELAGNPWVNGDLHSVRCYAAMPLIGREGHVLGTVCAWSPQPGSLTAEQRAGLRSIRDTVMRWFDHRRDARVSARTSSERE